jgi:hypothetical protein
MPDGAIAQHHGVSEKTGDILVTVVPSGGGTLILIYGNKHSYTASAKTHRRRAKAVAARLKSSIISTWNGGDGHCGISVVIDRSPPTSLVKAIASYRAVPDVFNFTASERARHTSFWTWYQSEGDA